MERIDKSQIEHSRETATIIQKTEKTPVDRSREFMESRNLSTLAHTFDNFDQSWKGTEEVFAAARALGEGTTDKPFLLIYGPTGNGKSYLVEAIIIALGQRGIWARYWTAADMFGFLKAGINAEPGRPNVEERIEQVCRATVLVLDELGVEKDSDWNWPQLERIIEYRYRFQAITIIATNLDIQVLEKKTERIVSRFSDRELSRTVLNTGLDYRPGKREERDD